MTREVRSEPGGAVADYGAHAVHFALNANTVGALSVQSKAGGAPALRAHAIGLCYWFLTTGESVMISEIQAATGQILPAARVLYRGALGGDHDLLYSYTDDSIEQFVVMHKRLPRPEDVIAGANPSQVWVGVISEMVNPPEPRRIPHPIDAQGLAMPSSADLLPGEDIYLGNLHIPGQGRAFVLGSNGPEVPTATAWHTQEGAGGQGKRSFVIDFVPYPLIEAQIRALPQGTLHAQSVPKKSLGSMLAATKTPAGSAKPGTTMLLARAGTEPEPGVAIDYSIVSTRLLNVNFGGGTKVGYAAVGQTSSDYWNGTNFAGASVAVLTNLAWSDTNSSTVGIIVSNAPGVATNTLTTDPMYSSYVMPTNTGSITLTITNVPSNTYNLYLYGHGTNLLSSSTFYLARAGTQLAVKYTTQWSPLWKFTNWEPGIQYVVFKNVTVTNQNLQITVSPGADNTAYLNGLQIVASSNVPPPQLNITNLLNINFGAVTDYKTGFAAVGLTASDHWNGYLAWWAYSGTMDNLIYSDGTDSGAGLVILNAPGVWNDSIPDNMYQNYLFAEGENILLTLTNLAAGNYDFYCYGHSGSDTDNTYFQVWAGGRASDLRPTTLLGSGWNGTNWDEGQQYVCFRNIEVKTNEPVVIEGSHSSVGYATLNGIQIVYKGSADTNGNGLADAWEMRYFGNLTNTASASFAGDFSSNAHKYQLGLDPTLPYTNRTAGEIVWVEDGLPVGAYEIYDTEDWNWVNSFNDGQGWNGGTVTAYSGLPGSTPLMNLSALGDGIHQQSFISPNTCVLVGTGQVLFAYINLDPSYPSDQVMLQWCVLEDDGSTSWEYRAYWGNNDIGWGTDGTVSCYCVTNQVPTAGQWVRLEVPASAVGLEGKVIQGMSFNLYNGRAAWDRAGILITNVDDSGLPDWWQIQYFGRLGVNPNALSPSGDGWTLLQKYQNGMNPLAYNQLSPGQGLQVFTPLH